MKIFVNGEPRDAAPGTTLEALLTELAIRRDGTAVARNGDVVPRSALATTPLADGDTLEIIVAVAGG
jgi:sulfur carrier protein